MSSAALVQDSENKPVVQSVDSCQPSGVTAHRFTDPMGLYLAAVRPCNSSEFLTQVSETTPCTLNSDAQPSCSSSLRQFPSKLPYFMSYTLIFREAASLSSWDADGKRQLKA